MVVHDGRLQEKLPVLHLRPNLHHLHRKLLVSLLLPELLVHGGDRSTRRLQEIYLLLRDGLRLHNLLQRLLRRRELPLT